MNQNGFLIISLDFELFWGVRDKIELNKYQANIAGVRSAIPKMLDLFKKDGIHATWATIGFLFFETKQELLQGIPENIPDYKNKLYSSYHHIDNIGQDEFDDPYHYAPSLIKLISTYPYQEIATHTFSHYYCLEKGQNSETFRADLKAAISVGKKYINSFQSLVFPRNQVNETYLSLCEEYGIKSYRGNEKSWLYAPRNDQNESYFRRLSRFLDAYIKLSGYNSYRIDEINQNNLINIAASRFLRPYSATLKFLEPIRLKRILSEMTHAAREAKIFHLWWHPHNFGTNTENNIQFLSEILAHYCHLRDKYGMNSLNMEEFVNHFESSK